MDHANKVAIWINKWIACEKEQKKILQDLERKLEDLLEDNGIEISCGTYDSEVLFDIDIWDDMLPESYFSIVPIEENYHRLRVSKDCPRDIYGIALKTIQPAFDRFRKVTRIRAGYDSLRRGLTNPTRVNYYSLLLEYLKTIGEFDLGEDFYTETNNEQSFSVIKSYSKLNGEYVFSTDARHKFYMELPFGYISNDDVHSVVHSLMSFEEYQPLRDKLVRAVRIQKYLDHEK